MKKIGIFLYAALLFCCQPLLSQAVAFAEEQNFVPYSFGVAHILIDPQKNQLTLLVNGVVKKKYRIAMGKPETPSPVGEWKVVDKHLNWGSGFGTRWIGLNVPWGMYGIHGTNRPGSIGHDASHGCIRMLNRDVEDLYRQVHIGTRVIILGHPMREPHMEPRRLAAGDSGSDVQLVQNRLRGGGYYHGTCNGKFGPATERAMKAFEKDFGLQVDGVVGFPDYQALGLLE